MGISVKPFLKFSCIWALFKVHKEIMQGWSEQRDAKMINDEWTQKDLCQKGMLCDLGECDLWAAKGSL